MQCDIVTGGLHLNQNIALRMAGNSCLLINDGYLKKVLMLVLKSMDVFMC